VGRRVRLDDGEEVVFLDMRDWDDRDWL